MNTLSHPRIVIIGAGPAGCSCAIALLTAGIEEVTLLDSPRRRKFEVGESIPPSLNVLLKQLGLYRDFLSEGHEPCYGSCSYWGNARRGYNDTLMSPFGHGWHLDRNRFNTWLVNEVQRRGGRIRTGHTYQSFHQVDHVYALAVKDDQDKTISIPADFVVDASGSRSILATNNGSRKQTGIPLICLGLRYKMTDTCTVRQLTHLESVAEGWWYVTRIPGRQLLVTFYSTSETVKNLRLQDLENWKGLLRNSPQTYKLVENLELYDHKLFGFQAPSFCLDRVAGERWVAIGDAASTYDPITSHGIYKSISHGILAAQCLMNATGGTPEAFTPFEQEVQQQYQNYKEVRRHFYQLEHRWSGHPFWKEMHSV